MGERAEMTMVGTEMLAVSTEMTMEVESEAGMPVLEAETGMTMVMLELVGRL